MKAALLVIDVQQGLQTGPQDVHIRKTTPDSFLRTELEATLSNIRSFGPRARTVAAGALQIDS